MNKQQQQQQRDAKNAIAFEASTTLLLGNLGSLW